MLIFLTNNKQLYIINCLFFLLIKMDEKYQKIISDLVVNFRNDILKIHKTYFFKDYLLSYLFFLIRLLTILLIPYLLLNFYGVDIFEIIN